MLHHQAGNVVFLALALLMIANRLVAVAQQVTCFTSSSTCATRTSSEVVWGTQAAGKCCLDRGGKAYRSGTSTTCTACATYGFFESSYSTTPLGSLSVREGQQLYAYFGFVSGTYSGSHSVSFNTPDSYRLYTSCGYPTTLSTSTRRVQFSFNIYSDGIALQAPFTVSVRATVDGSSEFVMPFSVVILDSDVVTIGFRDTYTNVTEGAFPPKQYPRITLAKDKITAVPIPVQVLPLTVDQFRALGIPLPRGISYDDLPNPAQSNDFDGTIINLTFGSTTQSELPNVGIVDDTINEGEQQFICLVRLTDPYLIASGNVVINNPSTVIRIIDNDMAVVGFVDDQKVVTEGEVFKECIAVTQPPLDATMTLSFFVTLKLIPDTADDSDVETNLLTTLIGPFDNANRTMCFEVTALRDSYFEENQTFTYVLSLLPEQQLVVISPNVTQVTILDSTSLAIGFDPTQYHVKESGSSVTLNVAIFGNTSIQGTSVKVMFSTTNGTAYAGQDYEQKTELLTFSETVPNIPVAIGIINNGYNQDNISFEAKLVLQSPNGYELLVTISPYTAITTITNDINARIYLALTKTTYVVRENQNQALVCLVAAPAATYPLTIKIAATEDDATSARSSQDFIAETLMLTIPPNASPNSPACVAFTINDNKIALEANKSFSIQVFAPPQVSLLTPVGHVLIVDDNVVSVNFTHFNYSTVQQGPTTACVSKNATTASNINVEIVISDMCGPIPPQVYTVTLVAGPSKAPACFNVTAEGWSLFQATITKVTSTGGDVTVGTPSSASVRTFHAGCLRNEDVSLCHYVSGTPLCKLSVYNHICCNTCGMTC